MIHYSINRIQYKGMNEYKSKNKFILKSSRTISIEIIKKKSFWNQQGQDGFEGRNGVKGLPGVNGMKGES